MRRLVLLFTLIVALAGSVTAPAASVGFRAEVKHQKIEGSQIAYYERGTGQPLILLTGTGSTMSEWDPALLRELSASRRLVLLDYPGLGKSGPAPGGHGFPRVAGQIAQFIHRRQLKKPDVLGWSMGGFIAQELATKHPALIGRVVLAGTNPGGSHSVLGPPWVQRIDSHAESDQQALKLLYPRDRRGRSEGRKFLNRLISSSGNGEIPNDFRVPPATLEGQVRAEDPWLRSNRNWRRLGGLEKPVLVTAGVVDPATPPANARRIADRIPAAELRLFAGAHAFLFQSRARFSTAVNRFLIR